ncbi:EamA family transporter [Derxia gummosa]|uniref:EamA family transporter n=1 Tax=Derxia gummosa DSM 723 TaxID=1121388 RepID=A0A8B6XDA7_9BURK|nr:EamA family transporter [Derxia gummosa]
MRLGAATGALILFGCVQAALLLAARWHGEPAGGARLAGAVIALGGLGALLLPGASAPALPPALLMAGAGLAWAGYTLAGRGSADALADSARNFALGSLPALVCWLAAGPVEAAPAGVACALASGALASGLGYAAWYAALPALGTAAAGTAQLSVPVITALGGLALGEPLAPRTLACGAVVLTGVALALRAPARR